MFIPLNESYAVEKNDCYFFESRPVWVNVELATTMRALPAQEARPHMPNGSPARTTLHVIGGDQVCVTEAPDEIARIIESVSAFNCRR